MLDLAVSGLGSQGVDGNWELAQMQSSANPAENGSPTSVRWAPPAYSRSKELREFLRHTPRLSPTNQEEFAKR